MGSLSANGWLVALGLNLCACGSRSGIDRESLDWSPLDAQIGSPLDVDASVDRVLDRPPRIEAGCAGEALPSPRVTRVTSAPRRLYPVVLHDPTRQRALVVGGLPASGTFTREVLSVSTVDASARSLGQASVDLALDTGVAWIDPGRTALIIGGLLPGAGTTARVLRMDVEDNAVRFTMAGDHPGGAHTGSTAVFDPARRAVIVHGGQGSDTADARPFSTTWLVRLDGGAVRWEELVSSSQSPPAARSRVGGIDPRTGALVMIGGFARDGVSRSVWSLSAGERPRWTMLDGAADALARSGATLEWDPVGCGFLVVGGRCSDQLWLLRPEGTGVREALLGTMRIEMMAGLARESAGVVFDRAQRSLTLIAGVDCSVSGMAPLSNVSVELR